MFIATWTTTVTEPNPYWTPANSNIEPQQTERLQSEFAVLESIDELQDFVEKYAGKKQYLSFYKAQPIEIKLSTTVTLEYTVV